MKKHDYPQGAIRSLTAVRKLVARAERGETVKVYSWRAFNPTAAPNLQPLIIKRLNRLKRLEVIREDGVVKTISLRLRHVSGCGKPVQDADGYLFENYWHAYAHDLRQREAA